MSRTILVFAALSASYLATAQQTPFQIADQLGLVPTPQEIALGGERYPLDGWMIMGNLSYPLVATGVSEINDRITHLGGTALPVNPTQPRKHIVEVASVESMNASERRSDRAQRAAALGPQGYLIELGRNTAPDAIQVLHVIGADDLGALYGCMTLRQLIQPGETGPVLLAATVRDWPAFHRRCLGNIGRTWDGETQVPAGMTAADAYLAEFKPYVQWLARHKINMTNVSVPSSLGDRLRREIMDYGRQYGLQYRYIYGTAINTALRETGTEWTNCVTREDAQHCWTAFEAHEWNARRIAQAVKESGYDYVVHHVVDSGSLPDPETWSRRCDRCKARYGDDHPRAAAEQIKLYHDIIKEANPNVIFEAVLQPYHFQWAVPGFVDNPLASALDMPHEGHTRGMEDPEACRAAVARATAIHRTVAAALPPDAMVTFREAGKPEFDGCCALWEGHPVDIWVYYGRNMAWEGLWEPQVRFTKSWHRDEPRDLLFNAPVGRMTTVNEIYAAGSAEYAWNVNQPDAEPTFDLKKLRYATGGWFVSDYQRESLLPRLCQRMWGRSGAAVLPLFANNVSFNYMGQPEYVAATKGEAFDDPYQFWAEQTDILAAAVPGLDAELARIDAGGPSGVYGDLREEAGYYSFMMLYYYAQLAAAKGRIESVKREAARMAYAGDTDGAKALVTAFQEELPGLVDKMAKVKTRVREDKRLPRIPDYRPTPPGSKRMIRNQLDGYDFAAQEAEIAGLMDTIAAQKDGNPVPEHLAPWLANRKVTAARVSFKYPFKADAGRGEGGWTNACPVQFFTTGDGDTLARFDTSVRLCWDHTALYIYAELADAPSVRPVAQASGKDPRFFEDDCFQVFLAPGTDPATYYHFAVSATGASLESYSRGPANAQEDAWECAAKQSNAGWLAEMRIPFATLGVTPQVGDTWRINLGRNRAPKATINLREISNIIGTASHYVAYRFVPMTFVADAPRPPAPSIALVEARRADQTVDYGFATQLWLRPEIRSFTVAHDASVSITVRKADAPADEKPLLEKRYTVAAIPGYWTPAQTLDFDLGTVVADDLLITVAATAPDGALDAEATFRVSKENQVTALE